MDIDYGGLSYAESVDRFSDTAEWQYHTAELLGDMRTLSMVQWSPLDWLEFGCGTGRLPGMLSDTSRYVGTDINRFCLRKAKIRYSGCLRSAEFLCREDLLGFSKRSFDNVVAIHSLSQVKDIPKYLRQIKYVLRPKGLLGLIVPNSGYRVLMWARNKCRGYKDEPRGQSSHTGNGWRKVLEKQGFDIFSMKYCGDKPWVLHGLPVDSVKSKILIVARTY